MSAIQITIAGNPPRKNARHRIVTSWRSSRVKRKNSEEFNELVHVVRQAAVSEGFRKITDGLWSLMVTAYWPRQRHLDDCSLPFGDHDAPTSCISDALQMADVIDDDIRIMESVSRKAYDAENPRTEIVLIRIDEEAP